VRILVTSAGSRGDIQPVLALALGLQARGHAVRFAAPPNFADWVRGQGLPFEGFGRDVEAVLRGVGLNVPGALAAMRADVHSQFAETAPLLRDAEVVIGASLQAAARSLAEAAGIPYFHAIYSAQLLRSTRHPPPLVTWHGWPAPFNRLSWATLSGLMNGLFLPSVNEERRALGLRPSSDIWDYLISGKRILAADPALAPIPDDYRGEVFRTGAWELPERDVLDPALEAFIEAGPAPVYIGFGSMPDKRPERTLAAIIEAVRLSGVRAVIGSGWAGLGGGRLPDTMRVVGAVPHGRLFPRMAAIVHHGGAGTTHTAARAGVPQVIVPHLVDQFHWAHTVHGSALSPPPLRKPDLTGRALGERIAQAMQDVSMRARARELAAQMKRDGVARAIEHIESEVGRMKGGAAAA